MRSKAPRRTGLAGHTGFSPLSTAKARAKGLRPLPGGWSHRCRGSDMPGGVGRGDVPTNSVFCLMLSYSAPATSILPELMDIFLAALADFVLCADFL